jgi:hypothetical protein
MEDMESNRTKNVRSKVDRSEKVTIHESDLTLKPPSLSCGV